MRKFKKLWSTAIALTLLSVLTIGCLKEVENEIAATPMDATPKVGNSPQSFDTQGSIIVPEEWVTEATGGGLIVDIPIDQQLELNGTYGGKIMLEGGTLFGVYCGCSSTPLFNVWIMCDETSPVPECPILKTPVGNSMIEVICSTRTENCTLNEACILHICLY